MPQLEFSLQSTTGTGKKPGGRIKAQPKVEEAPIAPIATVVPEAAAEPPADAPKTVEQAVEKVKAKRTKAATGEPKREVSAEPQEEPAAPKRRKAADPPAMNVPTFGEPVFHARTITLYPGLDLLIDEGGFYEINGETGVIGITQDLLSGKDVDGFRVPLTRIKGLFRVQYIADMQAEHPTVMGTNYTVYFESNGYSFFRVTEKQFEALHAMLPKKFVTRCFTYLDMADNKRGYTFDFPEFPCYEDMEAYRAQYAPVQRRKWAEPEDKEPQVKVLD